MPRDSDLDVVQAILRIGGSIDSGDLSTANIAGTLINPGIGFPSATLVSIIRPTPDGGQVNIRVDLDRALIDPRERILIKPKDLLVLQERPDEALARYFYEMIQFKAVYTFINSSKAVVTGTGSGP